MGLRTTGQQPPQQVNPPAPAPAAGAQPVTPAASSEPTHGAVHPELVGSPDPGQVDPPAADPATPAAPADATPAAQPSGQPIVVDGRTFRDAQELALYTQALQQGFQMGHQKPPVAAAPVLIEGMPIEQAMFQKPEAYNAYVIQAATENAVKTLREEGAQRQNEQTYWGEFYNENPDLKPFEFIVKSSFNQEFPALGKMSVADSKKHLAQAARLQVDNVRKASGITSRELPAGGARALGASGAPAPAAPATPAAPKTFIQQIRDARPKRA